jgi:hypothetical protein
MRPALGWVIFAAAAFLPTQHAGKSAAPVFRLTAADGTSTVGSLTSLKVDGSLTLRGAAESTTLDVRRWLTLRRDQSPVPPHPRGPQVVFGNGDRVPLKSDQPVRLTDNRLEFCPSAAWQVKGKKLAPPLSTVTLLWLGGPDDVEDAPALLRRLVSLQPKKDVVWLRTGDRVEGTILKLDSNKGCVLKTGRDQEEIPWSAVTAAVFSKDVAYFKLPDRPYLHTILADGSRLGLAQTCLARNGTDLQGETLWGTPVEFSLADLVALEVRGGAAVYLSDLQPVEYKYTPYLGAAWSLVRDGSAGGHELRLVGSTFDKGLGMHSESRVRFALEGKYRWFEAQVGLDPEEGRRGRVKIRVLVDGESRDIGWNKELTARDGPLTLRLDIGKARELTLEVLFGSTGDVQGQVNWVDARLVAESP